MKSPCCSPGTWFLKDRVARRHFHRGTTVRTRRCPSRFGFSGASGDWPGREHGLSPREAEVVALITQGLSNQEIADRADLSINTVKTFIRLAYGKIGVTKRTEAVVWGIAHGFRPDMLRTVNPALFVRRPTG